MLNLVSPLPKNLSFQGTTRFYAVTDVHQNTDFHSRLTTKALAEADKKDNVVLLDNGDQYMGVYPKEAQAKLYPKARQVKPAMDIVFNVGNNDIGWKSDDKDFFKDQVKKLNKAGVHVISANMFLKGTEEHPEGIKPYAIIEKDGDKLLYLGFGPEGKKNGNDEITFSTPDKVLEKMAPELKQVMKTQKIKGMVMLVHDQLPVAEKLRNKAKSLGLEPEFVIGGHSHKTYESEGIFYPGAFAKDMKALSLKIDGDQHSLSDRGRIKNASLSSYGPFNTLIHKVNNEQDFDKVEAKFIIPLDFARSEDNRFKSTELGSAYADGIKSITNSEIGIVSKGWIRNGITEPSNGNIKKIDLLRSVLKSPQPKIQTISLTPEQLKGIFERKLSRDWGEIHEFSNNMELTLDKRDKTKVSQITLDKKPLFDERGKPLEPDKKIKCAIDYFTIKDQLKNFDDHQESPYSMYDGFVHQIKYIEQNFKKGQSYPKSKVSQGT